MYVLNICGFIYCVNKSRKLKKKDLKENNKSLRRKEYCYGNSFMFDIFQKYHVCMYV